MTREPLRVLHLEASEADHEALVRHAQSAGMNLRFERVSGVEKFMEAMKRQDIDLILADPPQKDEDPLSPLRSARSSLPGVPLIVVTGSIGEDAAADCMLSGACDIVHKERLDRLSGAITRAMKGRWASEGSRAPWAKAEGGQGSPEVLAISTRGWQPEKDPLHAQKVEWVGNLAGGVAHDFNNHLTVISGYASMLLDREGLPTQASEALKRMFTASGQATGLVRQLMLFGRKRALRREVMDLNAELAPMVATLRGMLGETYAVEFEPAPESPRVHADIGMIEQVLMSLVLNAKDAMGASGRLHLATAVQREESGEVVRLSVRDSGCGMTPQVVRRLFTPFFTTKPEGRGTGLGLATSDDIIRRHGGWIDVRTCAGSGTEFRVYLPTTQADLAPASGRPRDEAQPKVRVLLVEDEPGIRDFAAAVLQQAGFVVLIAKSAEAALEVWRWHSERIDLLVTDVVLPGEMSGPQLAERLSAEKPSLRTVLATGYSRDVLDQQTLDAGPLNVLHKPYTPRALLRSVREALG